MLNEESPIWSSYNTTNDGFLIVGNFNALGVAESVIDPKIGNVKELRLHIHSDSENWVILSEVGVSNQYANYDKLHINLMFSQLFQIFLQDNTIR